MVCYEAIDTFLNITACPHKIQSYSLIDGTYPEGSSSDQISPHNFCQTVELLQEWKNVKSIIFP